MADENRSMSPRPFRSLDRANPLPSPEQRQLAREERHLSRKGNEQLHRQRWIGVLGVQAQQIYGKVQDYGAENMAGNINHHFDLVAQMEQSGDARKAKAMEEFAYDSLDDGKFNYRQITDTVGAALNKTVADFAAYEVPPKKGWFKR